MRPMRQICRPLRSLLSSVLIVSICLHIFAPVPSSAQHSLWHVHSDALRSVADDAAAHAFNPLERLNSRIRAKTKRADLILYNRVPKSGSTSMQDHIDKLSRVKALHYVAPPYVKCPKTQLSCLTSGQPMPAEGELAKLVNFFNRRASKGGKTLLIDFHFRFVDFEMLNETAPVYFNTIRNPVSRIISHYFYARFGPRSPSKRSQFITEFGSRSISKCLDLYKRCNCSSSVENLAGPLDCMPCTAGKCFDLFYSLNTQMMYFCPWGSPKCVKKGPEALEEAKRVLVEKYEAVGVLEHMQESLEVLEAILPDVFEGVSSMAGHVSKVNNNKGKDQQSVKTMQILEELNALDMEFYRYYTRETSGSSTRPLALPSNPAHACPPALSTYGATDDPCNLYPEPLITHRFPAMNKTSKMCIMALAMMLALAAPHVTMGRKILQDDDTEVIPALIDGAVNDTEIIPVYVESGVNCSMELQIAFKSVDEDRGLELCDMAAEYLTNNVSWGMVGEEANIEFECYNVTTMFEIPGLSMGPTFGGIHAFNDFYGILSIRPIREVEDLDVEDFFAALEFSGTLAALALGMEYPTEWLSSCCSDPVFAMADTCGIGSSVYGKWAMGCQICSSGGDGDDGSDNTTNGNGQGNGKGNGNGNGNSGGDGDDGSDDTTNGNGQGNGNGNGNGNSGGDGDDGSDDTTNGNGQGNGNGNGNGQGQGDENGNDTTNGNGNGQGDENGNGKVN